MKDKYAIPKMVLLFVGAFIGIAFMLYFLEFAFHGFFYYREWLETDVFPLSNGG